MNEYKPQPVARYLCIAILILFAAVGLAVWFEGPGQGLSRQQVKLFEISLAIGCIVSLLLARYYEWLALRIQLLRARLWVANYDASKRGEATTAGGGESAARPGQLATIRDALHVHHGLRWRYRQPWLLLTGDDAAIARLLPELTEQGWLITPDAVLLWSKTNKEGWPDADWLGALYRLRRRRPVDAVILTTDSAVDLQAQRRGTHPDGMRLARIAELLRWSAPVYLLDVPPRQNGCRPDRIRTPGARMKDESGQVRKRIQGQGCGAHAAARERIAGRRWARDWRGCGYA